MKAVQILVCLCLFLIKGGASIYAGTRHDAGPSFLLTLEKKQQLETVHTQEHVFLLSSTLQNDDRLQCIVHDDAESEDEDSDAFPTLPCRLPTLQARPSYRATLTQLRNCYKLSPPLRGPTTAKYIALGVLRI